MERRKLRWASVSDTTLSKNYRHGFAANHAISIYRSGAIYSFIPKNACTSLRTSIAIWNGCIDNTSQLSWIHKNNQTFKPTLRELAEARYTFIVLRCPYRRLASVFLDKFTGEDASYWLSYLDRPSFQGSPKPSLPERALYRLQRERHQLIKLMGHSKHENLTFADFIGLMHDRRHRNASDHWTPQVEMMVYEDYDDYFCIENFGLASSVLREKIGLEVLDTRQVSRHGLDSMGRVSGNFAGVGCRDLAAMKRQGKAPHYRSMYSDELAEAVASLYRDDLLEYKKRCGSSTLLFDL